MNSLSQLESALQLAERLGINPPGSRKKQGPKAPAASAKPVPAAPKAVANDSKIPRNLIWQKSGIGIESLRAAPPNHNFMFAGADSIGFDVTRTGEDGQPCGTIFFRRDGLPFSPYVKDGKEILPERKSHNWRGSEDGLLIFGRDMKGKYVRRTAAIEACDDIVSVEGVPDALAIFPLLPVGSAVVSNICGASARASIDMTAFKNKRVFVAGDSDKSGQAGARALAVKAAGEADEVYLLDNKFEGDLRDFVCSGGTASQLASWMKFNANRVGPGEAEVTEADDIPRLVKLEDVTDEDRVMKRVLIECILRACEILNIVAASKNGKSWLVALMSLCIATGRPFLGRFETRRGKVLIVDNELELCTLLNRIEKVATAMGLSGGDWRSNIRIVSLRGKQKDLNALEEILQRYRNEEFAMVVLDAWYRLYPSGVSENDNAAVTQLYNSLVQYAAMMGSAFAVIHHSSKGDQSEKRTTDVGSGASAQARAADTHLVLRDHGTEGCAVLDAAVRSFPPLDPISLRWEFPLWSADDSLPVVAADRRSIQQKRKDDDGVEVIVEKIREVGKPQTARALRPMVGMGPDRIDRLLYLAEERGRIQSRSEANTILWSLVDEAHV